jgi:integrase
MPPSVRELLWPLQGQHLSAVFTYITAGGGDPTGAPIRKGECRPVTYSGLAKAMALSVKRAGIRDFRFHDLRHSAATRLLRTSGNLNIVKRMLRHENIQTTVKYAHSQHDDVLAAMEATATAHRVPTKGPHTDTLKKTK